MTPIIGEDSGGKKLYIFYANDSRKLEKYWVINLRMNYILNELVLHLVFPYAKVIVAILIWIIDNVQLIIFECMPSVPILLVCY